MWFSMMIAIALVLLAVAGYFYVSQREKPIDDNSRYMMVYEDGLFEVFFGLLLITSGILLEVYAGMVGILFAVLYPLLIAAKALITKPRLDLDDLPTDVAKRRQLSMIMVLGLMLAIGILIFLISAANIRWLGRWQDQYSLPTLVLLLVGLLVLWAYLSNVKRLYLYAAFVLIAYMASFWLYLPFPTYLVAVGASVMFVGLLMMAQFIREHPRLFSSG